MQQYPPGDGFGADGLDITAAGLVYRFNRPAHRVLVRNTGTNSVYVGFNEALAGLGINEVTSIAQGRPTQEAHRLSTITLVDALSKGVEILKDSEVIFECVAGGSSGRKAIYSLWFITAENETATVKGGIIGM